MDLLKTGLLDGNPLEVQGTTYESFPISPLLIVPEVITPSLELNFATGKQLDSRITFTRGSSGTFINENGNVVGKTPSTTSSITPSTTAIGSQVTVTVASGSVVGWVVGQAISLIVDTDGQDDPDAGELWLLGDIVSSTLTTLTFTVTSRTATAGSATSWTLGYRGPRFTHDPVTLASLGLLVEESRTNLALRSQQIGASPWAGTAVFSQNSATAPDGTTTASTVTTQQYFFQDINGSNGSHTASIWAKASSGSFVTNLQLVNFATSTVVATVSITVTTTWTRFTVSGTTTAGAGAARLQISNAGGGVNPPVGSMWWGAQLEAGAFATSYIPTTSATATRAADVATMTGTNFSSWYNATQGAFVSESIISSDSSTRPVRPVIEAADSTNGNLSAGHWARAQVVFTAGHAVSFVFNSTVQASFSQAAVVESAQRISLAYASNDCGASINGNTFATDTNASIPAGVNTLNIGKNWNTTLFLNGTIARIRYYRRRLPNANLQTLTT